MTYNKSIETTLVHEFWCCKRELGNFFYYQNLLLTGVDKDEIKISCFTSYGNFLRHLYSFFEGVIQEKNKELIKGLKKDKIGERISELLTDEAKNLIRNKFVVMANGKYSEDPIIPDEFGSYLRHFRNWFSHVNKRRVDDININLFQFYKAYHYLALVLFESADFSWSTKSNYDWNVIRDFADNLKKSLPPTSVTVAQP